MGRSNGKSKRHILEPAIAIVAFICFFVFIYLPTQKRTGTETADVVIFGDSIYANECNGRYTADYLRELTDRNIKDFSLGGTTMAFIDIDTTAGYLYDQCNMAAIADAFEASDFAVQKNAIYNKALTQDFAEKFDEMSKVDIARVNTVVIGQMLNDYHAGVPIGDTVKGDDRYTYEGALRSVIRTFKKLNPDIRIFVTSATYTWYVQTGDTCENNDFGGGYLEDYVSAAEKVCLDEGVTFVDLYHDLYDTNEEWSVYSADGLHPNNNGMEIIARRIAEALSK